MNKKYVRFGCVPNEISEDSGTPIDRNALYRNRVDCCIHLPNLYSEDIDTDYGKQKAYFCFCPICKIGTESYFNPMIAVNDWDSNKTYTDSLTPQHEGVRIIYG